MGKHHDYKHPRVVKVASISAILVLVSMIGLNVYIGVAGTLLGQKIMTNITGQLSHSNSSSFGNSTTLTELKEWMILPIANNATIGFDVSDIIVQINMRNSTTSFNCTSNLGTIAFGTTSNLNITILDVQLISLPLLSALFMNPFNLEVTVSFVYFLTPITLEVTIAMSGGHFI